MLLSSQSKFIFSVIIMFWQLASVAQATVCCYGNPYVQSVAMIFKDDKKLSILLFIGFEIVFKFTYNH